VRSLRRFNDQQGAVPGDHVLQRRELNRLGARVKVLVHQGLMYKVKSSETVRLLNVLGDQMGLANGVEIDEGDDESSERVQDTMMALDVVSISLLILGADNMPKEVYRAESIDQMVDLIKYHMIHNVFVFFDASYHQIHRGAKEARLDEDNHHQKIHVQINKRRKSTASSKRRNIDSATKKSTVPKVIQSVHAMLSGMLTQLAKIIFLVSLPNATVLQMINIGISALVVEDIDLIQVKGVDVVAAAFKQYPEHRSLVVDHILLTLLKLPPTGRSLRRYMFADDDSQSIQVLTAMLMKCVQASVTFPDNVPPAAGDTGGAVQDSETMGYGPAFCWSHYFWKELLKGWQSAKVQEIDIKGLMQNLVTDVLVTLNMPEWPVASLMLLTLCAQLLSSHGINCSEIKLRELALDFIGQVAARIKGDMLACEHETLWLSLSLRDRPDCDSSEMSQVTSSAELAHKDAVEARTKRDASDSEAVQAIDDNGMDMLVLEAMLLRYLYQTRGQSRFPSQTEPTAVTFIIAQLAREAERRGMGFRSGTSGPGGDRLIYQKLRGGLAAHSESSFSGPLHDGVTLPRTFAIRLNRMLQQRQPLSRQLDILFRRLLGALEDSAITVRAAAVRAIGCVVDADTCVLGWEHVQSALEQRMTDNGTLVRSAIIDLLGKHVVQNFDVAGQYYATIVERISDVGVGVRKRVINVLHDCLRTSPNFAHGIGALRCLAFRILDDDIGIQELIVHIFRDMWFSRVPMQERLEREMDGKFMDPVAERAEQLVEVLWEVYCGVSRTGLAKLPLLPTFPIVAILRRVLFPAEEVATLAPVLDEGGGLYGSKEMIAMAGQLCNAILNGLLLQEECDSRDTAISVALTSGRGTGMGGSGGCGISSFPRTVRYALGLHVFCATDPQLCVDDDNPMSFATALQPYIKRCENNSANSMQLQCCISVVDAVVKEVGCLAPAAAMEIEKDLRYLLLRNTYHGVLYYASRCICSIADTGSNPGVASGALQICRRFVKLLNEVSAERELSIGERAHVSRALFVLGHLARFGAGILEASEEEAVSPPILLHQFRSFLQRTNRHEFDLKKCALQACGFLFVSRPQLMLSTKGGFGKGSMDGIMRAALSPSAERGLKEQALLNVDEYLREEEARTRMQTADDSSDALANGGNPGLDLVGPMIAGTGGALARAKRRRRAKASNEAVGGKGDNGKSDNFQNINGEHDNSLANGVAQRYWSDVVGLCTDPEPSVRLKALQLADVVLRQGLVHPMSCFPPLIALQADPIPNVRKLALRLLRQQHGKYRDFFDHQLGVGLELLFDFCKRLESAAHRAMEERQRIGANTNVPVSTRQLLWKQRVLSSPSVGPPYCALVPCMNSTEER